MLRWKTASRNYCKKPSISAVDVKKKLQRLSTVGCQDSFEGLVPCAKLLRPRDLKEIEHFRRCRQIESCEDCPVWGAFLS